MRTTRTAHRLRAVALAATTAGLALALTACGGSDSGNGKAGKADSGKAADARPGTGGDAPRDAVKADAPAEAAGGGSGTTAEARAAKAHAGKGSAAGSEATTACTGDEMSYHVVHRFPKQPGEHLLISAKNADSKPCWVTSYPSVMLGDSTSVLAHSAKDAPGGSARITVRPGATVYAAVNLFADGSGNRTAGGLSLALRDQTGDSGPATEQDAFDAKDVPTKFTWASADVTHWNTAKPYDF
ncbi:DUF4232 domain-containing protein [Streptomyces sp. NBC_00239]|uniref:DUF4232 domain-containing protein n=1 Tax=Streptomyces sp. NBC_00239 TaxID=2903640 RepID=UPI002E294413|nr:DUF4232 domain-containing protein [Streptomyces sp. NBC_00239]